MRKLGRFLGAGCPSIGGGQHSYLMGLIVVVGGLRELIVKVNITDGLRENPCLALGDCLQILQISDITLATLRTSEMMELQGYTVHGSYSMRDGV